MAPGMSWGEDVNLLSLCLMYGKTHYKDTIKVPKQTYFLFCSKYQKLVKKKNVESLIPGGVLPNMGSTGMCGPKG